jgi:hypothetical protein
MGKFMGRISVGFNSKTTVRDLKNVILTNLKIPVDKQHLFFGHK